MKGFTLVEIMLSVALLAVFIPAFIYVFSFSTFAVSQGENYSQAYSIGQEQMEAILTLKNTGGSVWDWTTTPSNTAAGEYYQPSQTAGVWSLGAKTTTPAASGEFTKLVEIKEVKRCGNTICSDAWGVVDQHSREIVVTVKWKENGQDTSVDLITIVNNI